MIFYSDIDTGVWDGQKIVPFVDGKLETDSPELIEKLQNSGYRSDEDGRETEQGDKEGPEVETEPTVKELREQAKEKGLKDYGKMNKAELLEAVGRG